MNNIDDDGDNTGGCGGDSDDDDETFIKLFSLIHRSA